MGLFNRNKTIITEAQQPLQESSRKEQLDISQILNLPYYSSVQRIQSMTGNAPGQSGITSEVKKSMLRDPLISRIINMWISDTLSKDALTHEIYLVSVNKEDKKVSDDAINEVNAAIDYLRTNSNLDEILPQILYNVIVDGRSITKLGFVDGYEDTNIKLFESNKKKLLNETQKWGEDDVKKLLEAPNYDDYLLDDTGPKKKNKKQVKLSGRYFIEMLPKRIVPLKHKGITILYLDLDNTTKVLNPKNITSFINKRGNTKTISLKGNSDDIISEIYEMPIGESFIDNAVTPWSMLNGVEDCTMLALMTRSAIYRLFQMEVGAMDTQATEQLIQEFKRRLTTRETINIREQYYSSANTQLPLGDSIIVPTRNGVGTINLQTVGNDLKIDTDGPLKYFREQLLAALGVPEGLVYGDTGNGGLINTSATKQDIRYLRTIQQFTYILSEGIESIIKDFLKMIGVDISKISIDVNFAQINNEQDVERIEYEQGKQEALQRAIDSLSSLGITFDGGAYPETRNLLITRYLDSELLDTIKQDEEAGNGAQAEEPPEEDKGPSGGHGPSGLGPSINNNIDLGGPEEENGEETEETGEENAETGDEIIPLDDNPTEAPGSATPENRPPYS